MLRERDGELRRIQNELLEVRDSGQRLRNQRGRLQEELNELDTQEGKQLKVLEKSFPDVARGWKWLRENNDKFEAEVFGPPLVSCSIKDKRYSDHVQSLLQNDDFLCFTTQSREDHKKLSNYFFKELGLSVSIRTCLQSFSSFQSPSREEAAKLGFDAFAIEHLAGPEPVLAMLCSEKRLHLAGIALRDVNDNQYNHLMNDDKVTTWATGRQSYKVTRRRDLGPQAVSTMTRGIRPGRWWRDEVDSSEKQELQRRFDVAQEQFDELKAKNEQLRQKEAEIQRDRDTKSKYVVSNILQFSARPCLTRP